MDKAKTCTFIGHKDSYGINPELLKAEIVKLIVARSLSNSLGSATLANSSMMQWTWTGKLP